MIRAETEMIGYFCGTQVCIGVYPYPFVYFLGKSVRIAVAFFEVHKKKRKYMHKYGIYGVRRTVGEIRKMQKLFKKRKSFHTVVYSAGNGKFIFIRVKMNPVE